MTHDRATMPDFAYARVIAGQPIPGVFVVNDRISIRQAIDELLLMEACSEQAEWACLVVYLPLESGFNHSGTHAWRVALENAVR